MPKPAKRDIDPIQIDLTDLIAIEKDSQGKKWKIWRGELDWIDTKGRVQRTTRIVRVPYDSPAPGSGFIDSVMKKLGVRK